MVSRAINGVPTPTLTLQLSHHATCNELANGEDDVLSRLWFNQDIFSYARTNQGKV